MKFGSKVINRQCFHRRTGLETFKFGPFHGRGAVIELLEDHAWVKKRSLFTYVPCTITLTVSSFQLLMYSRPRLWGTINLPLPYCVNLQFRLFKNWHSDPAQYKSSKAFNPKRPGLLGGVLFREMKFVFLNIFLKGRSMHFI